jgi:hypothetical protein
MLLDTACHRLRALFREPLDFGPLHGGDRHDRESGETHQREIGERWIRLDLGEGHGPV